MFNKIQQSNTNPADSCERKEPAMTLTVENLINELNISRKTAYDLVKREDFPSFNIGNRILISRKGLQEWIDLQTDKGRRCT